MIPYLWIRMPDRAIQAMAVRLKKICTLFPFRMETSFRRPAFRRSASFSLETAFTLKREASKKIRAKQQTVFLKASVENTI